MPKIKTNKAVSKKIKITGKRKALRRHTKQNHYNSKQTGNSRRTKRNDQRLFKKDEKNILAALPYN